MSNPIKTLEKKATIMAINRKAKKAMHDLFEQLGDLETLDLRELAETAIENSTTFEIPEYGIKLDSFELAQSAIRVMAKDDGELFRKIMRVFLEDAFDHGYLSHKI